MLPEPRQQPNLFFAALRLVADLPRSREELLEALVDHGPKIAAVMKRRTTQTNEAGRCATLLPVLALIDGPIALLEVGASAGLCLLPDFYGYDYGQVRLSGAPLLPCRANGETPLPRHKPEVVWRAGLDLDPVDLEQPEDVNWLRALVWPEQRARANRLESAIELARLAKPRVEKGNLLTDLADLAAEAPRDAHLVIFHTAVLCYVAKKKRARFAQEAQALSAAWISNEAPDVFPEIAALAPPRPDASRFLMAVNGRPVAWTQPHGASIDWLADPV